MQSPFGFCGYLSGAVDFSAGTQEFKVEEGKKHVTFGDHVESHPWFGDWIGEMKGHIF